MCRCWWACCGLIEPATLARRRTVGSPDLAGALQHSVNGGRTCGNYVGIDQS